MTATVENDCRGGLFENGDGAPGSVEHFKSTMYSMQSRRRSIVRHLLDGQGVEERAINALQDTLDELQDADTINYQREMTTAHDSFSVNIRDETVGLKKDLSFLSALREAAAGEGEGAKTVDELLGKMDLSRVLAPHHPKGEAVFRQELEWTERFLLSFVDSHSSEGRRPVLITDWDGTMKDYCSQYATNLQPVYSAVTMARFATRFTRLSAVLTAGPLRGPGILDLTALPIDGPVLFSGSWGREWWLGGRRVVHDDGISDEGFDALERLNDEMGALLSGGDYTQFALVGSGVQRKVDRLTLGVQTVCGQVAPELSTRYQEEVRERMHRVDPYQQILVFDPSTELEVEVCVHSSGTVWNKANGVSRLVETVGDSLRPPGRVLICGDTSSDLPMVRQAKQDNTQGVMALFVGANEALQKTVRECVDDDSRVCFVSCPDVIHAAMSRILVRKMESSV